MGVRGERHSDVESDGDGGRKGLGLRRYVVCQRLRRMSSHNPRTPHVLILIILGGNCSTPSVVLRAYKNSSLIPPSRFLLAMLGPPSVPNVSEEELELLFGPIEDFCGTRRAGHPSQCALPRILHNSGPHSQYAEGKGGARFSFRPAQV